MPEKREKKPIILRIPIRLRFALAWTIFFAILGIIIQSIQAGRFVFVDFFIGNYASWFRLFAGLIGQLEQEAATNLILSILNKWYYFFYTGGLISLIWNIIFFLINREFRVR